MKMEIIFVSSNYNLAMERLNGIHRDIHHGSRGSRHDDGGGSHDSRRLQKKLMMCANFLKLLHWRPNPFGPWLHVKTLNCLFQPKLAIWSDFYAELSIMCDVQFFDILLR